MVALDMIMIHSIMYIDNLINLERKTPAGI